MRYFAVSRLYDQIHEEGKAGTPGFYWACWPWEKVEQFLPIIERAELALLNHKGDYSLAETLHCPRLLQEKGRRRLIGKTIWFTDVDVVEKRGCEMYLFCMRRSFALGLPVVPCLSEDIPTNLPHQGIVTRNDFVLPEEMLFCSFDKFYSSLVKPTRVQAMYPEYVWFSCSNRQSFPFLSPPEVNHAS